LNIITYCNRYPFCNILLPCSWFISQFFGISSGTFNRFATSIVSSNRQRKKWIENFVSCISRNSTTFLKLAKSCRKLQITMATNFFIMEISLCQVIVVIIVYGRHFCNSARLTGYWKKINFVYHQFVYTETRRKQLTANNIGAKFFHSFLKETVIELVAIKFFFVLLVNAIFF